MAQTKKILTQEEAATLQAQGYNVQAGQEVMAIDGPQQTTALGAGTRAAAASVLPSLAGGAGFAGGMAAGGALAGALAGGAAGAAGGPAAPLTIPLGLLLGAVGAYGTSRLASAGQEALLPESTRQTLATGFEEHPVASTLGSLTTLPLGGLSPFGKGPGLGTAVRGLSSKLLTGAPMQEAERYALQQAAAGATINTAIDAATAPLEGREITPGSLALSAGIGAAANKPTPWLGAKFGFRGFEPTQPTVTDPAVLRKAMGIVDLPPQQDAAVQLYRKRIEDFKAAQVEKAKQDEAENVAGKSVDLEKQIKDKQLTQPERTVKPLVTTETGKEIMPDYTGVTEQNKVEVAQESAEDLAMRQLEGLRDKYSKQEDAPISDLQRDVQSFITDKKLGLTDENRVKVVDIINKEMLAKQGLRIEIDGTIHDSLTGEPVKGQYNTKTRRIAINPNQEAKATLDTLAHEPAHDMWARMTPQERAQWEQSSLSELAALNKKRAANGLEPLDAEEFFASQAGMKFLERQLNIKEETSSKQFWNDFKANFQKRWGKIPTTADLLRAWNYRLVHGKDVKARVGEVQVQGSERYQKYESNDAARYKELEQIMKTKPTPEAWQEIELLKNKYGGKKPSSEEVKNQPSGEGLTPEQERTLRLGKKGEGRTAYPFTEKERQSGPRVLQQLDEQISKDASLLSAKDELNLTLKEDEKNFIKANIQKNTLLDSLNPYKPERNQPASEGLTTKAEKLLRNPAASKLPFNNKGVASGNQLLGSLKNQLSPAEWDMLSKAGIEKEFKDRFINQQDATKWVQDNGPRVSVETYGMEGKVSEARAAYDLMKHEWYDNLTPDMKSDVRRFSQEAQEPGKEWLRIADQQFGKGTSDKVQEFVRLAKTVRYEPKDTSPRATSAYTTVSPLDVNRPMPEWTTSKSGKNVQRVDVVIPREIGEGPEGEAINLPDKWQPDQLHEQFSNTLGWAAIQYETGPKGEKIAHVFEAQSRWGQEVRNLRKEPELPYGSSVRWGERADKIDHPLLRDYNRLILKAAIEQAKKEGATHIAISDMPTAMLSEMLDSQARYVEKKFISEAAAETELDRLYKNLENGDYEAPKVIEEDGKWFVRIDKSAWDKTGGVHALREQHGYMLEREAGFDFNYDTSMPKIAEELTGSKGEQVVLGEHKNAFENRYERGPLNVEQLRAEGVSNREILAMQNEKLPRQNLIFRNPDGTPKTTATARLYPLEKVTKRLNEGDNFTLFNKYQGAGEGLSETDPTAHSFLPGLASTFDKVEMKVSKPIAEAGRRWEARRKQYTGKWITAYSDLDKLDDSVVNSAAAKMRQAWRNREDIAKLTPDETKAAKILRDYYAWNVDERRANGQLIDQRIAGKNENYVPDVLNEQARYTLLETPNSPEAMQMKKAWVDHVMFGSEGKLKREDVVRNINNYVDAMGSASGHYTKINFGAARKAEGYGLPEGMRENSAKKALASYGRRMANDMAFYKEIESNTDIASALKIRDPITGEVAPDIEGVPPYHTTKEVKDMMKWVLGDTNKAAVEHPWITSGARLTNNLLLGPATGLRDTASIPSFIVPYLNKWSDLSAAIKGMVNYRQESRNALETASRQPSIDKLTFGEINESPNRALNLLQKAATMARVVQGREAIENFNRDITFSIGKELARNNVLGAKAGHKQSQQFLKRFGLLVDEDITTLTGDKLEAALNQVASNFTDVNQGTYSGSGLPVFTAEGPVAPFLALQKWSIEKSNVLFKDVVKPFYTGENRIPLLTYLFGSVLTGAGIQQLNEQLSGKRGNDPTIEETLSKANPENIAAQIATILQLGTFGGIVGDGLKLVSDASRGKTPRNPLSFPAYSAAVDTAERISDAVGAINEGEDAFQTLYKLSIDLMANNVQAARMAATRLQPEETERKQNFRDVRVFEELEGKTRGRIPRANEYADLSNKQFKRTGDVREAAGMLPSLVRKERAQSESLEDFKMRMRGLKGNNYQTFPNPRTQPEAFREYYKFLTETQGPEEASIRLSEYMKQNQINKVKSGLVPSL